MHHPGVARGVLEGMIPCPESRASHAPRGVVEPPTHSPVLAQKQRCCFQESYQSFGILTKHDTMIPTPFSLGHRNLLTKEYLGVYFVKIFSNIAWVSETPPWLIIRSIIIYCVDSIGKYNA
jgi:hypothetical protein